MAIFQQQTGAANPLNAFNTGGFHSSANLVDINGDGDFDVFSGSFNSGAILFYQNDGNVTTPLFTQITGAANPLNSVDVGGGAPGRPTFADIDKDGDFDAFIGGYGSAQFWQNIGTPTTPNFTQITGVANPFNAYNAGVNYVAPKFADIDNDGDFDVFIGRVDGIIDYLQNTGTVTSPTFVQQTGAANPLNGVNVGGISYPSFVDIDKDGDLDAFIGRQDNNVDFWQNNGTSTSPNFVQQTGAANPFDSIDIGSDSSNLNFADINNDGDFDAFAGRGSGDFQFYENINLVATIAPGTTPREVGTAADGNFVVTLSQAAPVGGLTITYNVAGTATAVTDYNALSGSIFIAQGATAANINVTPLLDALVDPSETVQVSLTTTPTAAYSVGPQNTAVLRIADQTPDTYTELTGAANPLNSVNVGGYNRPHLVDVDGDGDLDAFFAAQSGNVSYYRNDGNATIPTFTSQTGAANPLNGVVAGGAYSSITFADIDGDGDKDAFLGEGNGTIRFFRNSGGGTLTEITGAANPFNTQDVGITAAPNLADIDGDGDLDAFVGSQSGAVSFYRNTGNATSPTLTLVTGAANPLNGVSGDGDCTPILADVDGDGDLDAVVGGGSGTLRYYQNTGTVSNPSFTQITGAANPFNSVNVGNLSAPSLADVDGDGDLDAFVGSLDGTVKFYENAPTVTLTAGTTPAETGPTSGTFTLTLNEPAPDAGITVNYTVAGTATSGNDYATLSGSVTVPSGANTATINVATIDDSFDDDAETVIVTLTDAASYNLGTPNSNTLTITDNDTSGVTIVQSGSSTTPTEGTPTDTYTVVLNTIPTNPVSVTLTPSNSQIDLGAGAGNPVNLNFAADATALNPQTVMVTAVDDAVVEGTHASAISHTATSSDPLYNGAPPFTVDGIAATNVNVNITDNDTAGVSITPSGGSTDLSEGGATDTYNIVLTTAPTATVTINFTTGSQVNSISSITFDNTNWNIAQTVAVQATDDAVLEGNHTGAIAHTATSADANYNAIAIASLTANITDNETAGISITPSGGTTTVTESGATDTYDIVLTSAPTAPVTIAFNTGSQVNPITSLTFDNTNWNVIQTVTVTATDDAQAEGNHNSTITHTATSADAAYNGFAIASAAVAITDNETAGVSITPSGGTTTVTEGGATDAYDIVLTSAPTAPVTISFNTGSQLNPIPNIVFDNTNWNIVQTLTVAAINDALAEGNHNSTITHSASSADVAYNGIAIASTPVAITDNDSAGISITPSGGTTTVTEGGVTDTYDIVLTSAPTAPVTINFNTGSQINPIAAVTFDSSNWNVIQTVTVTATNDALAEGNHHSTITHTATSTDAAYNGFAIASISSAITDNDSAGVSITPSGGITTVTEGGATDTYDIVLTSAPTAPVIISFSLGNQLSSIPDIVFDSTNWNIARTITVAATDDVLAEGNVNSTITHSATSTDANYNGIAIASTPVAITDNDSAGISITPSGGTTTVTEGRATDTYDIVLTTAPSAPVTINFNTGSQINPITSITFNSTNWNIAQKVTVTATDDALAEGNHNTTISHTASSADTNYNGIAIASNAVAITDNDSAGVSITPSGGTTTVTEGGAPDTYDIVLTTAPTAPVTIAFNTGSQLNPIASITFDNTNWNIAQTVTVQATDDVVAEGNHNSTITHAVTSSDANYNNIAIASTAVAITDNETAGVSITPSGGTTTVTEGGATDTYDIVLTTAPTAPVTINFNTGNQITPIAAVTFDSTNWNIAQTVTVSAINDTVAEGNVNSTITHAVTSSDANYNGIAIASTAVAITDNDSAGVSIIQSGGSINVAEGGATDTYNIVLTTAPTAPVTINFATNSQINPIASVTFDSNNWNIAQTVNVQAVDDAVLEGNHSSTITPTAISNDANYNGIAIASITASITDNDVAIPPGTPGMTLIQPVGNTNVIEGFGQDNYKLVLDSQPTDNVTITISTDGQTATDLQTLIFTPTNWNVAQTVTVTAIDDAATEGERVSNISHAVTSADARYNGLAISPVSANVSDNESPGLTINLSQASALGFTDFDDKITGSIGNDIIYGRIGNDIINGSAGNDVLYGQSGNNGIAGGDGNDILVGDIGNDHFNGNAGDDIIYADAGSDRARGGAGNDQLFGEDGNDRLFGDLGADTLTGGAGNDAFAIGLGMGGLTVETADFIADFTLNGDKIDLISSLTFNQLNIVQGAGVNINDVLIQDATTGEYLAVLQGVAASSLTLGNFV